MKERLFGLTNGPGNHGEDVKEYWCGRSTAPRPIPGCAGFDALPDFTARLRWLAHRRPDLVEGFLIRSGPDGNHVLLLVLDPDRLDRVLRRMLDEQEFLSPHGIRSMSAV